MQGDLEGWSVERNPFLKKMVRTNSLDHEVKFKSDFNHLVNGFPSKKRLK